MKPSIVNCPVCKKPVEWTAVARFRPFCSQRCKAVDLAKWFTGSYAVPGAPVRSDDDLDS